MEIKHCKIEGCAKKVRTLGMCASHYRHQLENGGRVRTLVSHEIRSVQIMALLPNSHAEIARILGCTPKSIRFHVDKLHDAGKCHIGTFKRQKGISGAYRPWIVAGPGENAVCTLKAQGDAVYSRRYRAKIKGTGCDADLASTNRSAARSLLRKKKSPDPLVSLLFGIGAS